MYVWWLLSFYQLSRLMVIFSCDHLVVDIWQIDNEDWEKGEKETMNLCFYHKGWELEFVSILLMYFGSQLIIPWAQGRRKNRERDGKRFKRLYYSCHISISLKNCLLMRKDKRLSRLWFYILSVSCWIKTSRITIQEVRLGCTSKIGTKE